MNTKTFSRLLIVTILFALAACGQKASDDNRYHSIRPGEVWLDTNGNPIQAHGFQVFYEDTDSMYYWYGENKEFTTLGSNVWTWGIRAYRSRDFYNWDDLGLIIPPDTLNAMSPLHFSQTLDRPHILYNKVTRKWVCWIKSMDTDGYFVIMQADRWLPQLAGTQIPRERAKWYAEEFKDHKAFDRDFSTPQVKDKRNMVRDEWETTRDATYVFLPVTFDKNGRPTIEWLDEWRQEDYK